MRALALLLAAAPAVAMAQIAGPAPCVAGAATLAGVAYPCQGVDLLSLVPTGVNGPLRSSGMNDIWGWTDPQTGREYALGGTRSGTVFVDVTAPTQPLVLGKLPTQTQNSTWRDIKVYRNVAYVVSEAPGHGLQVFDLTRLRGLAADAARDFAPDFVYAGFGSAHNLVLNEETGFAYAVGSRVAATSPGPGCEVPGFHAVSLANPLRPAFAGCFSDVALETGPRTPGYTHDAQCVVYRGPDAAHAGREICFAANEDVVRIFDATDKANVRVLGRGAYPNFAYSHQGWLTDDQRFLLVNDELDEANGLVPTQRTLVFDVADLDQPEYLGAYTSSLTTIDHNLYTRDGYAFESNYEAGLRILDVRGVAQSASTVREVASFDTYPQGATPQFNGQWSNYPYFASGIVVASDINNGLFVLRPTSLVTSTPPPPTHSAFSLSEPSPNPAASTATLTLSVAAPEHVRAVVLDATGREVLALHDAEVPTALTLRVDAAGLAAGAYVVRVVGETFSAARALRVVR